MTILSVDLASRRYQDIGIAVIDYVGGAVRARFVKPRHAILKAPLSVDVLAGYLYGIAEEARSPAIFIDGPKGGNTLRTVWSTPGLVRDSSLHRGDWTARCRETCLADTYGGVLHPAI